MSYADALVATSYPVYDYRYRADPDSPFRLYDCLKPALKKHVRVPEALLSKTYLPDLNLLIKYKKEKNAHKNFRLIKEKLKVAN